LVLVILYLRRTPYLTAPVYPGIAQK